MTEKNELDSLIKKIGKLHKMIRFVAIINKDGKIIKSEMRDEVPSLLRTKNEEIFCQDVTIRRKMREEFDKTLGKVKICKCRARKYFSNCYVCKDKISFCYCRA